MRRWQHHGATDVLNVLEDAPCLDFEKLTLFLEVVHMGDNTLPVGVAATLGTPPGDPHEWKE